VTPEPSSSAGEPDAGLINAMMHVIRAGDELARRQPLLEAPRLKLAGLDRPER
jgi:hypothetical protein